MSDGTRRPITHAATSFSKAEKNYPQVQREALALVYAVKKFHRYIYGRHFTLQTDHKPLLAIFGAKTGIPVHTSSRLQRYALILLAYDFNIEYVNTNSFAYADFVSRLMAKQDRPEEDIIIAVATAEGMGAQNDAPLLHVAEANAKILASQAPTFQTPRSNRRWKHLEYVPVLQGTE